MSRRVLVTGGAGFIGSHLVERLVSAGESVTVLDDLVLGRREWLPDGATLHEADLCDAALVRGLVPEVGADVIVHLAAVHFIPAVDGAPERAWRANVEATRNLLDAALARPPRLLLFASTAAVSPIRSGPIAETCAPAPVDLYGRTKLEGERLVATYRARSGSRSVIARIFNVVGPRETNSHVVPALIEQLRGGATRVRLGNLEPRRDYTDVRDTAAALHLLLSSESSDRDVFNVGSGRSVSVRELVELCGDILDRSIAVDADPARQRAEDRHELLADPRRLQAATSWRPTIPLRQTLAELLEDA